MKALASLFERDLNRLKQEIQLYPTEAALWQVKEGISNAGGNLCLHLVGNLKHFIGHTLGGIPYERVREKEFNDKDVPVNLLLQQVDETMLAVQHTLQRLTAADLQKQYPIKVLPEEVSTEQFLLHLYGHLSYHLGQINYHRRLAVG